MMKKMIRFSAVALTLLLAAPWAAAAADKPAAAAAKTKAKPYPLAVCAVADEKFGGDMGEPYVFVHEGREVKLCCKSCLKDFNKETAKYVKKIDEAAKKVKPYPLATCLVSDEELGSMGDAHVFIHAGREIKLCCKGCTKAFHKETGKFLKKWDAAAQKKR